MFFDSFGIVPLFPVFLKVNLLIAKLELQSSESLFMTVLYISVWNFIPSFQSAYTNTIP